MRDLAPPDSIERSQPPMARQKPSEPESIAAEVIEQAHTTFSAQQRTYLREKRKLTDEIIDRYRLGIREQHGERRVTIPIADAEGIYRDIRCWLPSEKRQEGSAKILHWAKGYGAARLFPIDQLEHHVLILVEGELDALALISHDFPAITATTGASTWPDPLSASFKGKRVAILMDADAAGSKGAQKRACSLYKAGAEVLVATWPDDRPEGWDVTDELCEHGTESLRTLIDAAVPFKEEASVGFVGSQGQGVREINWSAPQPVPDALPPVDPFAYDLLPDAFRPWIEDVSDRMQAPPDYPAVGAIVSLSSVVGRQLGVRPKERDDWTVIPNLWGGIVGPPSALKSPSLQETQRPLLALETRAREEYEKAMQENEMHCVVAEAQKKKAKDDVAKAVKAGRDPYLAAQQTLTIEDEPPTRGRYRTSDSSVEKLGELLKENPRGLLVFRDELTGFLRMLDRDGNEVYRAFFLESWNGTGRFTFDRIGRGTVDIEAACISILGGIQPGPLSTYMTRALHGGGDDDGLVQRFQLLVWPDPPSTWTNVDRAPDAAARQRAFTVFERLDAIDPQAIGAENPEEEGEVPFLRFTPQAQEIFNTWRTELERRLREDELPSILEAHLAKFRSLIPSLALLIHLADEATGQISHGALLRACAWGEYLESHARRIYAPALLPATIAGKALAGRMRRGDLGTTFGARDIQLKGWSGLRERDDIQAGLELLEDLHWIQSETIPTKGRPKTLYRVNPQVRES
jgi:hypothetical protein